MVSDCNSGVSKISLPSVEELLTFSYDPALDPTVTALSVTSASPILSQNIDITGTNFKTDASKMRVFLYDAVSLTQKYELGILHAYSETSMRCVLGGGRSGSYYVRVAVDGAGLSDNTAASLFKYEILVTGISPATGSLGGGYTLTISGSNFAPAKGSSQVFIGDGMNSMCEITAITPTEIQCTVPAMVKGYQAGDVHRVEVTGRLVE